MICTVKVPGSSLGRDTTFLKWLSQCLKRHANAEPQIKGRSWSVPSTSPSFRYWLSSSYSTLQSKLLTKTLNWQTTWLYRVDSNDRTNFPRQNTLTLSGMRDHYSFNDIFNFKVNWMTSLIAALSITTGLLRDFVIRLQSEEAATIRLINNFSGKIFHESRSEQKHLKILKLCQKKTYIYRVIQKDGLNFLSLYLLNYTWYVNDLHNIWKRRS
jgi:hypothetical protein